MRTNEQRLRVAIGNAADATGAFEGCEVFLEFGAERGVLHVVNLALEAAFLAEDDHTRALRSQVGVVINSEEHVQTHVSVRNCTEISAHAKPPKTRVVSTFKSIRCLAQSAGDQ